MKLKLRMNFDKKTIEFDLLLSVNKRYETKKH